MPAAQAGAAAIAAVSADNSDREVWVRSGILVIYRTGLAQGIPGENHLTWQMEVGNDADIREFVYVDAHSGKLVDRLPGIFDALNRKAYDGQFSTSVPPPNYPANPFWVEGQAFPTGNAEADNMITSSKETYDLYSRSFSRDSFNGAGATMESIFNRGNACPNASWNGDYISFCNGLTTDDVTGHEWTHAYTQYTHGLIYAWQPGALNESYSDIFGETIDRINGRDNVGNSATDPLRVGACTTYTQLPAVVTINSPAAIAGNMPAGTAAFGAQSFSVTQDVVLVNDGTGKTTPPTGVGGAGDLSVMTAARRRSPTPRPSPGRSRWSTAEPVVSSSRPRTRSSTAPSASSWRTTRSAGTASSTWPNGPDGHDRHALGRQCERRDHPSPARDDHRQRDAVAGTVRNRGFHALASRRGRHGGRSDGSPPRHVRPAVLLEPRKGLRPTVQLRRGRSRRVHNKLGVPNHAYALITDGGTYNGQTISGIGLTKAAHIYFRAMTVYQHPATDFADHADAIEQSATDLIGRQSERPEHGAASGQVISASDVDEVKKAMLAVEMRTPPPARSSRFSLRTRPRCVRRYQGPGDLPDTFEEGDYEWGVSHDAVVPADFTARDWEIVDGLPGPWPATRSSRWIRPTARASPPASWPTRGGSSPPDQPGDHARLQRDQPEAHLHPLGCDRACGGRRQHQHQRQRRSVAAHQGGRLRLQRVHREPPHRGRRQHQSDGGSTGCWSGEATAARSLGERGARSHRQSRPVREGQGQDPAPVRYFGTDCATGFFGWLRGRP
jgi:hypothetical protein